MALKNAKTPESRKSYAKKKVSSFCKNIRRIRLDRGLKQSDVAERMKVPQSQISKWEGGVFIDDPDTIVKLANALETDANHLFGMNARGD